MGWLKKSTTVPLTVIVLLTGTVMEMVSIAGVAAASRMTREVLPDATAVTYRVSALIRAVATAELGAVAMVYGAVPPVSLAAEVPPEVTVTALPGNAVIPPPLGLAGLSSLLHPTSDRPIKQRPMRVCFIITPLN
jgi:hypothetical protein